MSLTVLWKTHGDTKHFCELKNSRRQTPCSARRVGSQVQRRFLFSSLHLAWENSCLPSCPRESLPATLVQATQRDHTEAQSKQM